MSGLDIIERIAGRLIRCSFTDERSKMVDQCVIELDNNDGLLKVPKPDADLQLGLPYQGGFVDMGVYKVDTVELAGPPDIISIQARSADISDSLKQKREHSFEDTTLSAILNTVAGRNKLTARTATEIGAISIDHLDQTNESDLSFIARLGDLYDAVSSIKSGNLIFMPAGKAKTATGAALDAITITKKQCEGYRFTSQKIAYTGVQAFWNDAAYGKRTTELVGSDTNPFVIRGSFRSIDQAKNAAKAKWAALQREDVMIELELEQGNPLIVTESPLILDEGFTAEMRELDLVIFRAVHNLSESGFKTSIEAEKKG